MSATYEIRTLNDLLAIPVDRLSDCLRDLEYAIDFHRLTFGSEKVAFGPMTWTDDGNHSVHIFDKSGDPFLSLEVTDTPP